MKYYIKFIHETSLKDKLENDTFLTTFTDFVTLSLVIPSQDATMEFSFTSEVRSMESESPRTRPCVEMDDFEFLAEMIYSSYVRGDMRNMQNMQNDTIDAHCFQYDIKNKQKDKNVYLKEYFFCDYDLSSLLKKMHQDFKDFSTNCFINKKLAIKLQDSIDNIPDILDLEGQQFLENFEKYRMSLQLDLSLKSKEVRVKSPKL